MIISFLSSTLAKMNDILTWDPRRIRNWGSRYFSELRKNEKIKSLKIFLLGIISWQSTELSEVSIMVDSQALEKGTKSVQLLSRVGSTQSRASYGAVFPNAAQAPEKSASEAFPSKHPSCHFPFFWSASSSSLPQPTAPFLIISLWLAGFLSIWESLKYGGLWSFFLV